MSCPCCGNALFPRYTIRRFARPIEIVRCPECGLEAQASPPDDPDSLYAAGYYEGGADFSYRDERRLAHFDDFVHKARLATIRKHVAPPADFLDVGCAFGGLVRAAGEAGYRARGLDVSDYAVRAGREAGLDIAHGHLTDAGMAPASVDIVTMIEVIEHIADPVATFAALQKIVRPGGLVVIQTANFLGWQARLAGEAYHYYLPGHLYYYSTRTLRMLLGRHGFSRTIVYRPVDFGLLPKLRKSRGTFTRYRDYLRWLRIAWYHGLGRIAAGDFALTSSMTVYAIRDAK